MDYDATDIASTYDKGRNHGPENVALWMDVIASHVKDRQIKTILDLGCGTGRFSEALAVRFDAEVVGLDPSTRMLEQARRKLRDSRVRYETGRAEEIPLPDNSVDLVFMSMVYHHFTDPPGAANEIRRVLRDEGIVFLRAGTRDHIPVYPYVEFFPQSRPILNRCLPSIASVKDVFEAAGFHAASVDVITQELAPTFASYAEKLSAGADSILAQLSPGDFEAGMEALRSHATRVDGLAVFEPIDVFVFVSARQMS